MEVMQMNIYDFSDVDNLLFELYDVQNTRTFELWWVFYINIRGFFNRACT